MCSVLEGTRVKIILRGCLDLVISLHFDGALRECAVSFHVLPSNTLIICFELCCICFICMYFTMIVNCLLNYNHTILCIIFYEMRQS